MFNRFLKVDEFDCDRCGRRFYEEDAYSVASEWEELTMYPTFCLKCAERIIEKENRIDKRTLNKTGRVHQLGTRVRKEFLEKLKRIARKEKLKYVEVLEKALDCYEGRKK